MVDILPHHAMLKSELNEEIEMSYNLIKLVKDANADVCGTSLSGYVRTTYDTLVAVFGEPTYADDGDKVSAEWNFSATVRDYNDNLRVIPITIYDYKEPQTPRGIYDWHIGGKVNPKLEVQIIEDYIFQKVEAMGRQLAGRVAALPAS